MPGRPVNIPETIPEENYYRRPVSQPPAGDQRYQSRMNANQGMQQAQQPRPGKQKLTRLIDCFSIKFNLLVIAGNCWK